MGSGDVNDTVTRWMNSVALAVEPGLSFRICFDRAVTVMVAQRLETICDWPGMNPALVKQWSRDYPIAPATSTLPTLTFASTTSD